MSNTYNSKMFIGGEWTEASETIENINPSDTSDVVGHYASATPDDALQAVSAARAAFADWSQSGLEARKAVLDAIGDELIARKEELGKLLSREEGKPMAEGIGEVARAGQFFQYFGAEVLRQMGEHTPSVRPGVDVDVEREPLGVIGIITPWNFPTAVAAWKIAPALAFGNTVVLKASELVPASALALAEIISRSGLPAGAFNLVTGPGSTTGNGAGCRCNIVYGFRCGRPAYREERGREHGARTAGDGEQERARRAQRRGYRPCGPVCD